MKTYLTPAFVQNLRLPWNWSARCTAISILLFSQKRLICSYLVLKPLMRTRFFGLVFTTGAGEYWLSLFDRYAAMGLTLIAFIEIVAVMYVYGHRRFTDDIQEMTGYRYETMGG